MLDAFPLSNDVKTLKQLKALIPTMENHPLASSLMSASDPASHHYSDHINNSTFRNK